MHWENWFYFNSLAKSKLFENLITIWDHETLNWRFSHKLFYSIWWSLLFELFFLSFSIRLDLALEALAVAWTEGSLNGWKLKLQVKAAPLKYVLYFFVCTRYDVFLLFPMTAGMLDLHLPYWPHFQPIIIIECACLRSVLLTKNYLYVKNKNRICILTILAAV